eukprot:s770_g10.t1
MPSASTYLHVHRLRYLLSCLALETKELWALAHWEQSWLSSAASSVEWLWQHTDNGRKHASWQAAWAAWSCEARVSPGKWKAKVRAAQQCAVLRERWRAATNRHQGLLYKQLCALGARTPVDLFEDLPSQECCAPCQRRFGDLRAWAVHAFSVHGRVEESRCLATGTQCPACLRHYSANVKLSRHIRYSVRCRSQLLAANHRTAPEPGIRSRKAPDDGLCLLPALQAEGPRPIHLPAHIDVESDRPSAEVLDCLAHLDFDGSLEHCSEEDTWARIRRSFSCVCLQTGRIRATSLCWREHLQLAARDGRNGPFPMLLAAADWICQADVATWLVPVAGAAACAVNTYKSSGLHLSVLECAHVRLTPPCESDEGFICVHVGEVPRSAGDLGATFGGGVDEYELRYARKEAYLDDPDAGQLAPAAGHSPHQVSLMRWPAPPHGEQPPVRVAGLITGRKYVFQVRAVSAFGHGPWLPSRPERPEAINVEKGALNPFSAKLKMFLPEANGSPVTGCRLLYLGPNWTNRPVATEWKERPPRFS